jgi:hypothetical protein
MHPKVYNFGCMEDVCMISIVNQIENLFSKNPGKIYSINDFYYLGTKNTVKSAIYRLNEQNKITRIFRNIFLKFG